MTEPDSNHHGSMLMLPAIVVACWGVLIGAVLAIAAIGAVVFR